MMDFRSSCLDEFKEKLHSQRELYHRYDAIIRFMETQLRNCNDLELMRAEVREKKKDKDSHLERNDSLRQILKENHLKKERLLKDLDDVKFQEQEVIKDQESRVEYVKNLWRSYVLALGFYKSRLDSHLEYHEDYLIWTFKNISSDNKKKYMVKLVNKDDQWSCTDMVPKLKTRDALMETLKETNDIQGFLSNVRSRFKKIAIIKN